MSIPKESDHPRVSRGYAREWYWSEHDKSEYECPDCGRGSDRVTDFVVHHIDRDPTNNDPDNLIAVCERCHGWRHHGGPTIKGLDVEEWQDQFLALGGSND